MKKSMYQTMLLGLLAIVMLAPTTAQAYGAGDNTVRVGYLEGHGVVDNMNSIDNIGYGHDILEAAQRYSDLEFVYVPVTQNTIASSLSAGEIDLFGPYRWTSAASMSYEFSREFGVEQILLLANSNSPLLYDDVNGFQGRDVAVMSAYGYDSYLTSYGASKGVTFNSVNMADEASLFATANDLVLASSLMEAENRKIVANLGIEPLYFITSRGNATLMNAVNQALDTLELRDPMAFAEAHQKYYSGTTLAKPVLSIDQTNLLQSKGEYTVGYLVNHLPIEGTDDDGLPTGVLVDLMNAVAAEAGIKIRYSPYTLGENVNHSQFDLNIAWVGHQDFSQFYSTTDAFGPGRPMMMTALANTANPSAITTIGVLPFVTIDMASVQKAYPGSQLSTYNSTAELAKALKNEDIQGALLSDISSDYLMYLLDDKDFDSFSTSLSLPFRLFVSNNLGDDYVNALNVVLNRLDADMVEKSFIHQISQYRAEPTLLDIMASYWYLYVIGVLLVAGGFFGLYMYLEKMKQHHVLEALNVDEVTDLLSEVKFVKEASKILQEAEENEYMLCTFDIDHFSLIHKQYGFEHSNKILRRIGAMLEKAFPDDAIIARGKADLFLIFTKRSALEAQRQITDDSVLDCTGDLLASTYPMSVSQGVYYIVDPTIPVQMMIDYSNLARQQGKNVYGLTLHEYTKELDSKRELNSSIVLRMELALQNENELIPYFQPKVHLKTNMITGCEALVRWCDIDKDLEVPTVKYMPDEFIPLFEENGFITKLDYHIFNAVCSFIRTNITNTIIPKISINLSGVTLLKNDLRGTLMGTLESYRLSPRDIDLEITESAFTQYPQESASKVRMLGKEGFSISMDDFGTGASSLNRLKDMDITTIKLDKAFLDYNLSELKGSVIIGNMINMARRLGLEVVAEGVETKEQLSALKMLHCDLVQGYYYSRPVNKDDFLEMLQEPVCLSDVERKRLKAEKHAAEFAPDGPIIP